MRTIAFLTLACGLLHSAQGEETGGIYWSYKGPTYWLTKFESCDAERQSPVDIRPADTIDTAECTYLTFTNYNKTVNGTWNNNGHVLQFDLADPTGDDLTITGATLPDFGDADANGTSQPYVLAQLQLHWGSDCRQGSEHWINGEPYAAEMHLVHVRQDLLALDDGLATAKATKNGLAVVGLLFHVGHHYETAEQEFQPVIDAAKLLVNSGDSTVGEIDLKALLQRVGPGYYSYSGSLTTPPCSQAVTWIVMEETINIDETQLDVLREMKYDSGNPMVNNYRPVQPLFNRFVKRLKKFVFAEDEEDTM